LWDENPTGDSKPGVINLSSSLRNGKGGFMSRILQWKFMPNHIDWDLDFDVNDKAIGGELFLGDYFTLTGNVGEYSDVFLLFRYEF
jgi:hypothetical protein